jgi:hypothetical protein
MVTVYYCTYRFQIRLVQILPRHFALADFAGVFVHVHERGGAVLFQFQPFERVAVVVNPVQRLGRKKGGSRRFLDAGTGTGTGAGTGAGRFRV